MKSLFLLLMLSVVPIPVFAQTVVEPVAPECRVLPEHKAQTDVAYKAGEDVRGKPVVPADLNASAMDVPETIVIPLSIDFAQRLQGMNIPGLNMDSTVGFLEVRSDGRVTYDGRDLTSQVYMLCGQDAAKNPAETPSSADRQTAPDALQSAPVKETKPAE